MPSSVLGPVDLTEDERVQLVAWTRRRTSAQALALRSRIVLLAGEGLNQASAPPEFLLRTLDLDGPDVGDRPHVAIEANVPASPPHHCGTLDPSRTAIAKDEPPARRVGRPRPQPQTEAGAEPAVGRTVLGRPPQQSA